MENAMTATLPPVLGTAGQWGYVVHDIEQAMRHWTETLHIGPFLYIDEIGDMSCHYRGMPTDVRISVAFAYFGETQIELIQQRNDAPSPYIDFLKAGREGMQHLGFWAMDYDQTRSHLEARGYRPVYTVRLPGAARETVYLEAPDLLGTMIEIAQSTPQKARLFDAIRALGQGWDGSQPVRRYRDMAEFAAGAGVPSWNSGT